MGNIHRKRHRVNPNDDHPITSIYLPGLIFFSWLSPLFRFNRHHTINHSVLHKPSPTDESSRLSMKLKSEYGKRSGKRLRLLRSLASVFGIRFLCNSILIMIEETLRIIQILYLIWLMDYFEDKIKFNVALTYCLIIVVCLTLCTLIDNTYFWNSARYGIQVKTAITGLIYDKLYKKKVDTIKQNDIDNLITENVNRFDDFAAFMPFLIVGPVQLGFTVFYLTYYINYTILGGLVMLCSFVFVLLITGKAIEYFKEKKNEANQSRIKVLSETFSNIKNIKLLGLEDHFEKLAKKHRIQEIKQQFLMNLISSISLLQDIDLTSLATFLSIAGLFLFGKHIQLNPSHVIFAMAFCSRINSSVGYHVSNAIKIFFSLVASVKLLEDFLNETDSFTKMITKQNYENDCEIKINIRLENNNLKIENFKFGELIVIQEEKNALEKGFVKSLLGEKELRKYDFKINGSVYYVQHEPWIFNGTIKDNICFGNKYRKEKLDRVLRLCVLEKDIRDRTRFKDGINTLISDNGIDLSGGQKSRIHLARAIYHDAQIYIFENPLSAYDLNVAEFIKTRCIVNYLQKKLRIILVHESEDIKEQWMHADKIYKFLEGTDLTNINHTKVAHDGLYAIDQNVNIQTEAHARHINEDINETSSLITLDNRDEADNLNIKGDVFIKYFNLNKSSGVLVLIILLLCFIMFQIFIIGADLLVMKWAHNENSFNKTSLPFEDTTNSTSTNLFFDVDAYFRQNSFMIYSILTLISLFFMFLRPLLFFIMARFSSIKLHNEMFHSVISTNYRFFVRNKIGNIKSRFTNDLIEIDDDLPSKLFSLFQIFSFVIGTFLLSIYVNYIMLIPIIPLFLFLYSFRNKFMKISRTLKRLEAEYKGNILGHIESTINGLTIIRTCGKSKEYQKDYHNKYNDHTAAYFPFRGLQRWFAIRIDLIIVSFITFVLISCILMNEFLAKYKLLTSEQIGILLTYLFQLANIFSFCLRLSTDVETHMVSAERVKEYIDLDSEKYEHNESTPANWPLNGDIVFTNVTLCYNKDEVVLEHLNFEIENGKKIGIVARTGTGKTTISYAILRMIELKETTDKTDNVIKIGNENIKNINIKDLRAAISVIPQETSLFTGTNRFNLDPHGKYNDSDLYTKLHDIDSIAFPLESEGKYLDKQVNLDMNDGLKQTFCVARAILKDSKIYIIDEATSNLDEETEIRIQKIFRKHLKEKTVLTIAHRLETIKDYDKIMGLKEGTLRTEDFDTPSTLLNRTDSVLYELYTNLSEEKKSRFRNAANSERIFDERSY